MNKNIFKFIVFAWILAPGTLFTIESDNTSTSAQAATASQQQEACPICADTDHAMSTTNCCQNLICNDCVKELEQRAQAAYRNYHNPAWRARHAASPDFGGWPSQEEQNRQYAACPFCRHYPLETTPVTTSGGSSQEATSSSEEQQDVCPICMEEEDPLITTKFCKQKIGAQCAQRLQHAPCPLCRHAAPWFDPQQIPASIRQATQDRAQSYEEERRQRIAQRERRLSNINRLFDHINRQGLTQRYRQQAGLERDIHNLAMFLLYDSGAPIEDLLAWADQNLDQEFTQELRAIIQPLIIRRTEQQPDQATQDNTESGEEEASNIARLFDHINSPGLTEAYQQRARSRETIHSLAMFLFHNSGVPIEDLLAWADQNLNPQFAQELRAIMQRIRDTGAAPTATINEYGQPLTQHQLLRENYYRLIGYILNTFPERELSPRYVTPTHPEAQNGIAQYLLGNTPEENTALFNWARDNLGADYTQRLRTGLQLAQRTRTIELQRQQAEQEAQARRQAEARAEQQRQQAELQRQQAEREAQARRQEEQARRAAQQRQQAELQRQHAEREAQARRQAQARAAQQQAAQQRQQQAPAAQPTREQRIAQLERQLEAKIQEIRDNPAQRSQLSVEKKAIRDELNRLKKQR